MNQLAELKKALGWLRYMGNEKVSKWVYWGDPIAGAEDLDEPQVFEYWLKPKKGWINSHLLSARYNIFTSKMVYACDPEHDRGLFPREDFCHWKKVKP